MNGVASVLDLGAELRVERRRQGLTQAEVAQRANVSRAFVIDLERGRRPAAELTRVLSVAAALGLGVALVPSERPSFDDALKRVLGGSG